MDGLTLDFVRGNDDVGCLLVYHYGGCYVVSDGRPRDNVRAGDIRANRGTHVVRRAQGVAEGHQKTTRYPRSGSQGDGYLVQECTDPVYGTVDHSISLQYWKYHETNGNLRLG